MEQFKKSAAKGDPRALNALGWYALEREKDPEKAEQLFLQADKLGNADASHNLGHMYWKGRTANQEKELVSQLV
jgi:TPR repeat protein